MVTIAAVNRYRLTPKLPAPAALRALQRNSLAETALGIGVLLLVSALGILEPTTHDHPSSSPIPADATFVHMHSSEAMAEVTIDPGRAGRPQSLFAYHARISTKFAVREVKLVLDPPAAGAMPVERAAMRMADGTGRPPTSAFQSRQLDCAPHHHARDRTADPARCTDRDRAMT